MCVFCVSCVSLLLVTRTSNVQFPGFPNRKDGFIHVSSPQSFDVKPICVVLQTAKDFMYLSHQLGKRVRQCFSLDLIFLHLLQYTRFGILMIFGILLIQTLVLTYAAFVPLDLLKKGHFTAYSTYTRISGSLLQTCWIFLGQLLFGWFYLYSLYSSYDEVANAEYLFWSQPQPARSGRSNDPGVAPSICLGMSGHDSDKPLERRLISISEEGSTFA